MTTSPPSLCAACHQFAITQHHCDTAHGCNWWVCGECDAPNDGAGHFAYPARLRGDHAAVIAWAEKFGITGKTFTKNPPKGKTA